jgi:hypothetical protein
LKNVFAEKSGYDLIELADYPEFGPDGGLYSRFVHLKSIDVKTTWDILLKFADDLIARVKTKNKPAFLYPYFSVSTYNVFILELLAYLSYRSKIPVVMGEDLGTRYSVVLQRYHTNLGLLCGRDFLERLKNFPSLCVHKKDIGDFFVFIPDVPEARDMRVVLEWISGKDLKSESFTYKDLDISRLSVITEEDVGALRELEARKQKNMTVFNTVGLNAPSGRVIAYISEVMINYRSMIWSPLFSNVFNKADVIIGTEDLDSIQTFIPCERIMWEGEIGPLFRSFVNMCEDLMRKNYKRELDSNPDLSCWVDHGAGCLLYGICDVFDKENFLYALRTRESVIYDSYTARMRGLIDVITSKVSISHLRASEPEAIFGYKLPIVLPVEF